ITSVHVHPDRIDHRRLWERYGYPVLDDPDCTWSDGEIGGECCEIYCGDLEIGNLVNPHGGSTDVGFGWERIVQVVEKVPRVDRSSLFRQDVHPIVADHTRTVQTLLENGVRPGNKHREYVCRRLLRHMLRYLDGSESFSFDEWLNEER